MLNASMRTQYIETHYKIRNVTNGNALLDNLKGISSQSLSNSPTLNAAKFNITSLGHPASE